MFYRRCQNLHATPCAHDGISVTFLNTTGTGKGRSFLERAPVDSQPKVTGTWVLGTCSSPHTPAYFLNLLTDAHNLLRLFRLGMKVLIYSLTEIGMV